MIQAKKWTALFFAFEGGHKDVVKLLREYGANPDLRDIVSELLANTVIINMLIYNYVVERKNSKGNEF